MDTHEIDELGPKEKLILMLQTNQKTLFEALAEASKDPTFKEQAISTAKNVDELISWIEKPEVTGSDISALITFARNHIKSEVKV